MNALRVGRVQLRWDYVAFAVLLVVGFWVGLLVSQALKSAPLVSQSDYAVMVAQIYERDRNGPAATDRLALVGISKPAESLPAMADEITDSSPRATSDKQSLLNLANALNGNSAEIPVTTSGDGPRLFWLMPLVVLLLVALFGTIFAVKMLGVELPKLPAIPLGRVTGLLRPPARPPRRVVASRGQPGPNGGFARRPVAQQRDSVNLRASSANGNGTNGGGDVAQRVRTADAERHPLDDSDGGRSSFAPVSARSATVAATATAAEVARYSFRTSYHIGDQPYDEIHPIVDRRTKTLVGACGVSAARSLDDEEGQTRYYAFTAWVHDYLSPDQQLKAIGLVSKGSYAAFADEIESWIDSGDVDEVNEVGFDLAAQLKTANLSASLSISDFANGNGDGGRDSFLSRLSAQFDVTIDPREAESDDEV